MSEIILFSMPSRNTMLSGMHVLDAAQGECTCCRSQLFADQYALVAPLAAEQPVLHSCASARTRGEARLRVEGEGGWFCQSTYPQSISKFLVCCVSAAQSMCHAFFGPLKSWFQERIKFAVQNQTDLRREIHSIGVHRTRTVQICKSLAYPPKEPNNLYSTSSNAAGSTDRNVPISWLASSNHAANLPGLVLGCVEADTHSGGFVEIYQMCTRLDLSKV